MAVPTVPGHELCIDVPCTISVPLYRARRAAPTRPPAGDTSERDGGLPCGRGQGARWPRPRTEYLPASAERACTSTHTRLSFPARAERPAVSRRGEPPHVGGEQAKRPTSRLLCHARARHRSITRPLKYKRYLMPVSTGLVWSYDVASHKHSAVLEDCMAFVSMQASPPHAVCQSWDRQTPAVV
jgi:hypothetical protein